MRAGRHRAGVADARAARDVRGAVRVAHPAGRAAVRRSRHAERRQRLPPPRLQGTSGTRTALQVTL